MERLQMMEIFKMFSHLKVSELSNFSKERCFHKQEQIFHQYSALKDDDYICFVNDRLLSVLWMTWKKIITFEKAGGVETLEMYVQDCSFQTQAALCITEII